MATVIDRLRARAARTPDRPLYTFLDDQGREVATLSHAGTLTAADAVAAYLLGPAGLAPGDRALLVYPPGMPFVPALLGCLLAGVVPVPVCPPAPASLAHDLQRLDAMARSSRAKAILTTREYQGFRRMMQVKGALQSLLARKATGWPDLPWHTTDQLKTGKAAGTQGELAFLQYTSGSTSFPKGVRITQGNLVHQLGRNQRDLGMSEGSHLLMWVPHFHDFGLISGILSAAYGNGQLTFMSPVSFIRRPGLWLEVASRLGATHTAAPTFAYDLVIRKTTPQERASWDLSKLRVAMAAAEPVRPAVMQGFADALAPCGFSAEALCPAYGLAEHAVGVTVFGRGTTRVNRQDLEAGAVTPDASGIELMACGRPAEDVVVRIVSNNQVCPPGKVGEIWVDSPSKADGYDGLPDDDAFRASLGDGRTYLSTGDLGFFHEGQLYVTGRLKDLVIIRGRNLYPQDLELTVMEAHEAIKPGGVAAFSVEGEHGEELVVCVELRDEQGPAQEVAEAVRQVLATEHQVAVKAVVIGPVPKTTSGKVRRQDCRKAYLAGAEGFTFERDWLDLEPAFQALVARTARAFTRMSRGRRAFHQVATTLRGELRVRELPGFQAGKAYPVLVRHANGV